MKIKELLQEYGTIVPGINTTDVVDQWTTKREAAKLGMKVTKGGRPPLLRKSNKNNNLRKHSKVYKK